MDYKSCIVMLLLALAMVAVVESSSSVHDAATWSSLSRVSSDDMIGDDSEMSLDWDSSRRVLAAQRGRYISYEALKRNVVPCGRPGGSYYNCNRPAQQANVYRRGCSVATLCARYNKN